MNIIIYPFVKIGVFRCHNVDSILLNNIPEKSNLQLDYVRIYLSRSRFLQENKITYDYVVYKKKSYNRTFYLLFNCFN